MCFSRDSRDHLATITDVSVPFLKRFVDIFFIFLVRGKLF